MSTNPRRLGAVLAGAGFAADCTLLAFTPTNGTAADVTISLGALPKCRVRKATYVQAANATAATSFTCTLQNKTGTVAVTGALDIKTLVADTKADFVLSTVAGALDFAEGDILQAVFDETGGTVTAPGIVGIVLEVQLLD